MRIFVLTIEPEGGRRRRHAQALLEAAGLSAEFVQGFRGSDPICSELYDAKANSVHAIRPLTAGEVAVYAGHRQCWQALVAGEHGCGVVLEDDFDLFEPRAFPRVLEAIGSFDAPWHIVKLFDHKRHWCRKRMRHGHIAFESPWLVSAGLVGYVINRKGAELLLARQRIFRAVDEDIKYPWELGLRIWTIHPNPVGEASARLGGSLLDGDRQEARRQGLGWPEIRKAWDGMRRRWLALRYGG